MPVGCVFISPEGEVVAEGHNETNATMNVSQLISSRRIVACTGGLPSLICIKFQASRHAELVAIDASIRKTGDASKIAGSTL